MSAPPIRNICAVNAIIVAGERRTHPVPASPIYRKITTRPNRQTVRTCPCKPDRQRIPGAVLPHQPQGCGCENGTQTLQLAGACDLHPTRCARIHTYNAIRILPYGTPLDTVSRTSLPVQAVTRPSSYRPLSPDYRFAWPPSCRNHNCTVTLPANGQSRLLLDFWQCCWEALPSTEKLVLSFVYSWLTISFLSAIFVCLSTSGCAHVPGCLLV